MTEERYNELNAKSRRELLQIAHGYAQQHKVKGVALSASKFEILSFISIVETRVAQNKSVAC